MSRIGRKPINIPAGVTASVDNGVITVKGPKGTLDFKFNPAMTVEIKGDVIEVTRPNDAKENRSLHGLTRTLIHNMVIGVTEGYSKTLEVNGVGYRVQKQGSKCVMNLGYFTPRLSLRIQRTSRLKFPILTKSSSPALISKRLVSLLPK